MSDFAILNFMKRDWNNALIKRDTAWFERNFTGDASEINGTGAIRRRAKFIEQMKADKIASETAELSEMDMRIEGGTAVMTGVNYLKGRDEKTSLLIKRFVLRIHSSNATGVGSIGRRRKHRLR